jgi:signal transduction histidine kinase
MAASVLARDPPDPERRLRRVESIHRSARRMDNLIRDLVDATMIEHGGVQLAAQDAEVAAILRETADMFAAQASEKGLVIDATSPGGLKIACDRDRVLQVLGNLVANALRFTPREGRITLRAEQRDDVVRFEVTDTGPGVHAADLPHIFELYWNSDRKGAGLGLYIARSLVQAHGGQIGVDTAPGRGATFFFLLPIRPRASRAVDMLRPWQRQPRATS